ncbi:MAG: HlyD family secretion protein, partial [Pseudomonadota bacterium]|nr:HlyD family secretion protein [Pseudomonadota bacterium]
QIALDAARANLQQTVLNLESLKADYTRAQRQTAAQDAQVSADKATFDRYGQLVKTNAVTRQEYDDAKYKLAADQAQVGSSQAQARAAIARLGGQANAPVQQMPAYKEAEARIAEAQREANHAVVRAPFTGVVTRVSKLQIGQYLGASTPAFGLVSDTHLWVAAEPKETSLTWARPGQPVTVSIDTYPGRTWHGHVEVIAPATDQEFSLLPAQNSSGNWVKVVQRVPVRIALDNPSAGPTLSAGMSADVSIDTHHKRTIGDLL